MRTIFLFLIIFAIFSKGIVIEKVDREIDLSSHIIRFKYSIVYKNEGVKGINAINFHFPKGELEHIAYFEAKQNKKELQSDCSDNQCVINLKEELKGGSEIELRIKKVLIKYLKPLPEEITQMETQKLLFIGNLYFYSSYLVKKQTTTIKTPSKTVESFTKDITVDQNEKKIHYGPFSMIEEFSEKELKIHYVYNKPVLYVEKLLREVEVSHWGNLAVEEHYIVRHGGAKLKGGFSRLDYQRGYPHSSPSSFRTLTATLPREASDIYFRDRIGNISTSDCKVSRDKKNLLVEFSQRFPLFGGWKTTFYLGYNLPLSDYVDVEREKYVLSHDISTTFEEAAITDFTLKVIIPEGASNEKISVPFEFNSETRENRKTYLDTFGRPVIVLKRNSMIPELNKLFTVTYDFKFYYYLMEPLLVIAALFIICLIAIVYVRLDFSIAKKENNIEVVNFEEKKEN